VIVLEARERVGGRVDRGTTDPGVTLDLGGTWAGHGQDRILDWAAQFGVASVAQHTDGRNQVELGGIVSSYSGTIPRVGIPALLDMARMQLAVGRAAKRVDPATPWTARDAERLDAVTLDGWLRSRMHGRKARSLLNVACRTIWGAEADELSMLYVLSYIASAGGLDPLFEVEEGAQATWFPGGALAIAERAADQLGDRIRFHGRIETVDLPAFFAGMDVVVSPNKPRVLHAGNFDGFPTGSCTEAALCGVAVVASDVLGQNPGYPDGEAVLIVEPTAAAVAGMLRGLLAEPERIGRVARLGRTLTRRWYAPEAQIGGRRQVLEVAARHASLTLVSR